MAIASGVLMAAGAVSSIAAGAKKNQEGRKMQREAQKLIDKFSFDEFQNAYRTTQVSTLGADLRREELATTSAGIVDGLRGGGNRALVGGLGRLQSGMNETNRQIAADLDAQQKQLDYAAAGEDSRITDRKFQQQSAELAGYGQMLNVGLGVKYQGMDNMVSGLGALGQFAGAANAQGMFSGLGGANKAPAQQAANIQPAGLMMNTPTMNTPMITSNIPDYNKIYGGIGGLGYNNYF